MTNRLNSANPHGIRVAADRAPVRDDAKAAFAKGSKSAAANLKSLTKPASRRTAK